MEEEEKDQEERQERESRRVKASPESTESRSWCGQVSSGESGQNHNQNEACDQPPGEHFGRIGISLPKHNVEEVYAQQKEGSLGDYPRCAIQRATTLTPPGIVQSCEPAPGDSVAVFWLSRELHLPFL